MWGINVLYCPFFFLPIISNFGDIHHEQRGRLLSSVSHIFCGAWQRANRQLHIDCSSETSKLKKMLYCMWCIIFWHFFNISIFEVQILRIAVLWIFLWILKANQFQVLSIVQHTRFDYSEAVGKCLNPPNTLLARQGSIIKTNLCVDILMNIIYKV